MYRTISDFIDDWQEESSSTIKMFKAINDECLQQSISGEVRKIAVLSWHITLTPGEMLLKAGLHIAGPEEHSKPPATAAEIVAAYKTVAGSVTKEVGEKWKDAELYEMVNMYGQQWSKSRILSVLVRHQTHHRGQLSVLLRLCGLPIPGVYGPSREEWKAMGMAPLE